MYIASDGGGALAEQAEALRRRDAGHGRHRRQVAEVPIVPLAQPAVIREFTFAGEDHAQSQHRPRTIVNRVSGAPTRKYCRKPISTPCARANARRSDWRPSRARSGCRRRSRPSRPPARRADGRGTGRNGFSTSTAGTLLTRLDSTAVSREHRQFRPAERADRGDDLRASAAPSPDRRRRRTGRRT